MGKIVHRRSVLKGAAASVPLLTCPMILSSVKASTSRKPGWLDTKGRLKIGLLWSLTGNLALTERASRDVSMFWINNINQAGGIAGYEVAPVVINAKSDIKAYREGARHLMQNEKVLAIFGGYTSASRRAIMPLIELNRGLLFYPGAYQGRECWQRIVCTGPLANQSLFDLVPFMCQRFGDRAYFIGSNNERSREAHRNANDQLVTLGGRLVGESYIPVGYGEFSEAFAEIRRRNPDWVLSTVVGRSDLLFRQSYAQAGFRPDTLPTASITTSEIDIGAIGSELGEGHFVSSPYFQSIDTTCNREFVAAFLRSPFGATGVTHHTMESTYLSFLYFQKAVERIAVAEGASAITSEAVRDHCAGMTLSVDEAPEGPVRIDSDNFNSWLTPKIGRFNAAGQVDILFQRKVQVPPMPFLRYPSRGTCRSDGLHLPHGQVVKSAS